MILFRRRLEKLLLLLLEECIYLLLFMIIIIIFILLLHHLTRQMNQQTTNAVDNLLPSYGSHALRFKTTVTSCVSNANWKNLPDETRAIRQILAGLADGFGSYDQPTASFRENTTILQENLVFPELRNASKWNMPRVWWKQCCYRNVWYAI